MQLWTAASAEREVGPLLRRLPAGDGLDAIVYGSTLGDLVEVCRRCGGSCDVDVWGWTWRRSDAEAWGRAVRAGIIASGRFVTDATRLHPYSVDLPSLTACFPVEAIRLTHCHVKAWVVRGQAGQCVVLRTAEDPRLADWWTLTADPAAVHRWATWADEAFSSCDEPNVEQAALEARAVSPGAAGARSELRAWWPADDLGAVLGELRVEDDDVAADTLASSDWSLVDAAGEVARRLSRVARRGEVEVDLAVWRMAARETAKLASIGARRVRVVYGVVRRDISDPELRAIRSAFGAGNLRVIRNHAKMAIVRGGGRTVALLTSANPTLTGRLESWQCRSGSTAAFWSGWFEHVFNAAPAGQTVGREGTRRLVEGYRG